MIRSISKSLSHFGLALLLTQTLTGCAEIKKIISVFSTGKVSVNTSGFDIVQMSSGLDVTCNIMGDKSVRCLGSTENDNLGRFYGAPINSLKDVKQIALGKKFTCAIVGEHSALKCFGINDQGQLGNPIKFSTVDPVPVLDAENENAPILEARQITAGENHACALLKSGRAICWGNNSYGQSGNPSTDGYQVKTVKENEKSPRPFQGIQTIVAGGNSTCIIANEDHSLFCFGERFGSTKKINWVPEKIDVAGEVDVLSQVKQVVLGNGFGCALIRSQVFCWGNNDHHQLGSNTQTTSTTKATAVEISYPIKSPLNKIESITAGDQHACALHRDEGTVFCWGDNTYGQLGNTSIHGLPEQVAVGPSNLSLKGAKFIAAGRERTCTIAMNDDLFCWGNGMHGILGDESISNAYPSKVKDSNNDPISASSSISIGYDHACVIGTDKKIFCFGLNQNGQIGSRTMGSSSKSNVIGISTFNQKTCVIQGDKKTISCFGEENNPVPFQDALGVSVGKNHVCMINSDQQVQCIDYETKPASLTIIQTEKNTALKDISQLRSRGKWNCALTREKGEIWCWGELGKIQWPLAKQIYFSGKPATDFIQLSISDHQICGIHGVSAEVLCSMELDQSSNNINLQTLLNTDGKPLLGTFSISSGKNHTCVLNDKNQIFCWGSNELGQLGAPLLKEYNTPQKLTQPKHKITGITTGDFHTCFTNDTDLGLFCFGKGFFNDGFSSQAIEYPL